jgi:hypothetical protein
MEVTREVIVDLLPLYLADEASPETQALVEEYLERDPDLARLAEQWRARLPGPPPAPQRADAQAQAYQEAKRRIAIRTIGLGSALAAGIIALTALVILAAFLLAA